MSGVIQLTGVVAGTGTRPRASTPWFVLGRIP
ncbi:hypothetical protein ZOD2009_16708 [Haladaptatus paucihalophilus DX253]|uniref:Uncharacterized protein n=1 Tax=Haladaptatus paucihalophilus DX253 TaxID=797209 RepID=E7QX03_HALPU|nr:hypothetical protein ZOD2009_16708 [Haladaptatus paucihalophilus DX253]